MMSQSQTEAPYGISPYHHQSNWNRSGALKLFFCSLQPLYYVRFLNRGIHSISVSFLFTFTIVEIIIVGRGGERKEGNWSNFSIEKCMLSAIPSSLELII
jgi:hypothetical protein